MLGLKFRRQQVVGRYVLDFYCAELRLGIEIDGAIHDGQIEYDAVRDEIVSSYGIRILRIRNEDLTESSLVNSLSPFLHE